MAHFDDQQPFDFDDFGVNPDPRCACLLVLDTSTSMRGQPIDELNNGLITFKDELVADELSAKRVEVGILSFGPVELMHDFATADQFNPPTLTARGDTPMGTAIEKAIDLIEERKREYRAAGVSYYRPWIFLITDGAPTDAWSNAAHLVHEGEELESFAFFPVGVQDARLDILEKIATRKPRRLSELRFRDLFIWLSASLRSVSQSSLGTKVELDNTSGWEAV